MPVNRALMLTPDQEKRTDPPLVPGAVRPTMRRPATASPPAGLTAASSDDRPPSEPELVPKVVPELDPELALDPEDPPAGAPGLAPELDPELAFDPEEPPAGAPELEPEPEPELDPEGTPAGDPELVPDAPVDVPPELLDDPGLSPPCGLAPEACVDEEQSLAIHAAAPNVIHPMVLETLMRRPFPHKEPRRARNGSRIRP